MVEIIRKKPLIFTPDEEPKDMLIATFVVRQTIFEKVFKEIKSSSRSTAPQHFLLIGQSGMGKTTLLLRIKYALEDDPELAEYILAVRFPEEQYKIGNLADLWEETSIYLENQDTIFEGLFDEFQPHEREKDYERVCFDLLAARLKQYNKRIVFLVDNIGDLLHKFTDQENHRFREILMTCPCIQLIGASSEVLEYSFQYDKPFFEFFYQLKLEPLNKEESVNLMKALADNYDATDKIKSIIENAPQRIEALRRITGGVPRTLVLLFEIFIDYNDGSPFEDLEHLADKMLPLYKARMDSLKPQQQKIIDALACAWEAISASDILEQSKLYRENITSNQVSSQLKQLEDNQLVETVDIGKRKKLYRIRERFFNIWYLMRNGRKQHKEQVLWLIHFLESWCTIEEMHKIANNQVNKLSSGEYSEKAAYYKAIAIHSINYIDTETKRQLLKHTEDFLLRTEKHTWANSIHNLLKKDHDNDWQNKAYKAAIHYFLKAFSSGDFKVVGKIFYLYWSNNEHQKALAFCSEIFQQKPFFEMGLDNFSRLLIHLLAEEQYFFLQNEFKKENSLLMKYTQPVYYVVAWYLKDELPGEYEKAGTEIKETLDEIIKKVEDMRSGQKVYSKASNINSNLLDSML